MLSLNPITMPENWYKLTINSKQTHLYVNVKEQVCSLSPVFGLHQVSQVLVSNINLASFLQGDFLGIQIDLKEIEKTVQKLRKSVNINANNHPLLDSDEEILTANEEQKNENERVNNEIQSIVNEYQMKIYEEMSSLIGQYNDEVSLLNQIAGQYLQGIPKYNPMQVFRSSKDCVRDRDTENPKQRFYCSVSINNKEVGRGVGQNKKQSQQFAARFALKNLAPKIYEDWKKNSKNPEDQTQNNENTNPQIQKNQTQQKNSQAQSIQISEQDCLSTESENKLNSKEKTSEGNDSKESTQEKQICDDQVQIDDPELLTTKKHLTNKFTPLTIIKSLQDKHKSLSFSEDLEQFKNPLTNQSIFAVTFSLKGKNIFGRAEDTSKQKARQISAQKFLKNLFPSGFTWLQVVHLVSQNKEPLIKFMEV